jgi:biotin transport system ATP-binding protein
MAPNGFRITLNDVSLTLDDRAVFAGLSLDLDFGIGGGATGRIGLIGRNGSGKSQLLRLIAGLQAPDSGSVRVNGFDPAKDRKSAVTAIGYVFQNPEHGLLFPTVMEELCFGAESQGWSREEADTAARALLAQFGRQDWEGRLGDSLSMGQKHLLALLAICVTGPQLLLLDEVFAGLDLVTERRLRAALAGMPMRQIQASHDLGVLEDACTRMLWLDNGTLHGDGAPGEVIAAYRAACSDSEDLR